MARLVARTGARADARAWRLVGGQVGAAARERLESLLVVDAGSLYMRHENPHRNYFVNELLPIATDRFRSPPFSFTFTRNDQGETTAVIVGDQHYIASLRLARVPD